MREGTSAANRREPLGDPFQTKRQLKRMLEEAGVHLRRRLGQSFLIDRNLARVLVEAASLVPGTVVLEVGTGCGMLTGLLSDGGHRVVSVEVDRKLCRVAARQLAGRSNVRLICGNALWKDRLSPAVTEALEEEMRLAGGPALEMVSNLPYQIASRILVATAESELGFCHVACTVQKEVAQRVTAAPASEGYGLLSVLMQVHGRFEITRVLPPAVFWPRPAVESAIVKGALERKLRGEIAEYPAWKAFVKAAFAHRRKKLLGSLRANAASPVEGRAVAEAMERCGASRDARAEELSPGTLVALFREAMKVQSGRSDVP